MTTIHAHTRIDFNARISVGPGKISLLESIQRTHSLSESARSLGMSYRRAWLLVHNVNQSFTEPAVTFTVGGKDGGGASVTPFGEQLIRVYRQFERKLAALAAVVFKPIIPQLSSPAKATRQAHAPRSLVKVTRRRSGGV